MPISPGATGNDQFRFREAFVQAGNVLESQPDAKFWAGERFYRRQHIDIDDFYPLDMSGYGAGVEDFNVGIGKLALSYLSGARPDIITQNGNLTKSNVDLRFYDLRGPAGLWAGWFDFATSKGGTTTMGTLIPSTTGYAFGLRHQRLEWHGGYNAFGVQYGTGPASNFSTAIDDPTAFINSTQDFWSQNRWSFSPTTGSRSCPSSSTSEPRTVIRNTTGISGSRLVRDRRSSLPISLPRIRGRIRPHAESRSVRRLAAQIHNRAATRSRQEVLQPSRTACLSDICKLVERTPRFCGRRAIFKENERPNVRSTG